MRGQFEGLPVMLASATPALESPAQVEAGRYRHIVLPARYGGATLPDLTAIDMRTDPPDRGRWLAPPLVDALADRLHKGEQSLLFLNRRGFAPLTLCRPCGRSEEGRVGKECARTCRSRWSPAPSKTKQQQKNAHS